MVNKTAHSNSTNSITPSPANTSATSVSSVRKSSASPRNVTSSLIMPAASSGRSSESSMPLIDVTPPAWLMRGMLSLYVTRVKDRRKSQKGRNPYPRHKRQRDSLVQTTRACRTRVSNIIHIQRVRNLRTTASTVSFSGDISTEVAELANTERSTLASNVPKMLPATSTRAPVSRSILPCHR